MNAWPKHPDGRPKTMGEMTPAEQKEQIKLAVRQLQRELDSPEFKKAIEEVLQETRSKAQ